MRLTTMEIPEEASKKAIRGVAVRAPTDSPEDLAADVALEVGPQGRCLVSNDQTSATDL